MPSLYIFYGQDGNSIQAKMKTWLKRFSEKGDVLLDSEQIDGSMVTWETLKPTLSVVPLLSDKRLVVVRNLITQGQKPAQEGFAEFVPHLPDSTVAVLIEEAEIPAKNTLFALLSKMAHVEHFPALNPLQLRRILDAELKRLDIQMDNPAKSLLLEWVGLDYGALTSEVQKLATFSDTSVVTKAMVEELVAVPTASRIFQWMDAVFAKNEAVATKLLLQELHFGTAPLQLLSLLITQTRRALSIRDGLDRDVLSDVQERLKLQPFVWNKCLQVAKKISLERLSQYLMQLVQADNLIKTGDDPELIMLSLVQIP